MPPARLPLLLLAAACVRGQWRLDVACDGSDSLCWDYPGFTEGGRAECCNATKHGPYGKRDCWNKLLGMTYLRCCCYRQSGFVAHRVRFKLKHYLARKFSAPDSIAIYNNVSNLSFGTLAVDGPGLRGPAATANMLLHGMESRSKHHLTSALELLMAPKQPVLSHLASGWPVFALLRLLLGALERSDARKAAYLNASVELGTEVTKREAQDLRNACLSGSWHADLGTIPAFAAGCFDAAAASLPRGSDPDGAASNGHALLEEGQRALRSLGARGLGELAPAVLSALCESLHRLQTEFFLRGPCPAPMIHFQTEAEPNYAVCLPDQKPHAMERILTAGRWTDCDPLAVFLRKPVDIVAIDVGHNIGFCTGYLLANGVSVIAMDSDPESGAGLRASFAKDIAAGRLIVHTAAASNVSAPPGELTLDSVADGVARPVLLKMDIEGYELDALQGAANLLETRVFALVFDVHMRILERRGIRPWDIVKLLFDLSFRVCIVIEMGLTPFKRVSVEQDLLSAGQRTDNVVLAAYRSGSAGIQDAQIENGLGFQAENAGM